MIKMDMSMVFKNDVKELYGKDFYYSRRFAKVRNEKNAAAVIKPKNEKENGVEIILDRISKNPEENLSLDVASELAGFSKSHFSKLFKDITGFTYGNYTQMQRLFKARRLLEKTRDSVTQIAYECGFLNSGYFSTVFKDYFGMSPLEYRKDLIKPE